MSNSIVPGVIRHNELEHDAAALHRHAVPIRTDTHSVFSDFY